MLHYECWQCRNEDLHDQEGVARFALCSEHLRERVAALMMEGPTSGEHLEVA